jgi:hypothetical protein
LRLIINIIEKEKSMQNLLSDLEYLVNCSKGDRRPQRLEAIHRLSEHLKKHAESLQKMRKPKQKTQHLLYEVEVRSTGEKFRSQTLDQIAKNLGLKLSTLKMYLYRSKGIVSVISNDDIVTITKTTDLRPQTTYELQAPGGVFETFTDLKAASLYMGLSETTLAWKLARGKGKAVIKFRGKEALFKAV